MSNFIKLLVVILTFASTSASAVEAKAASGVCESLLSQLQQKIHMTSQKFKHQHKLHAADRDLNLLLALQHKYNFEKTTCTD